VGAADFIFADARGRVVSGSRGTVLGMGWLILKPLLDGAAYYAIFGLLLGTGRGVENFIGYLLVGVFVFGYTTRCMNTGSMALLSGRNIVKAFSFPRAALPLGAVVREALTTVPNVATMAVLVLLIPALRNRGCSPRLRVVGVAVRG
jgi:teichoic acid transport system permease protein